MNDEKKMTCAENVELAILTTEVTWLERENETLRQALSACGVEIDENDEPKMSDRDKQTLDQIVSANAIMLEALEDASSTLSGITRNWYHVSAAEWGRNSIMLQLCKIIELLDKAIAAAKGGQE